MRSESLLRIATGLAFCFATALLGLSLYVHFLTMDYGDKIFEMVYARMYVGGKRLYTDIQPLSPPMIMWLYAIPAYLAELLQTDMFAMLWACGLAAVLFSMYLALRVMALHDGFKSTQRLSWLAALLAFIVIFRTNPHYYLDREHLFFVFTLPYMLRFLPSLRSQKLPRLLAMCIGLLAAIGFCLKPQCYVLLLGIGLLYMVSSRSFRLLFALESLCVYGAGIAYVLAIFLLYPEYFSIILPMAMATYSADRDMSPVLDYLSSTLTILGASFLLFRWRARTPYRADIWFLLALCPFYYLYVVANNNWAYTYYPLGSMALIVAGFVLAEWLYLLRNGNGSTWLKYMGAAGFLICAGSFIFRTYLTVGYFSFLVAHGCRGPDCADDRPFIQVMREQNAHSFGALTMDFIRWSNLTRYSGASWETRFPCMWMLPRFLQENEAFLQSHRWIVDYAGTKFAEDLDRNKPDIVFVDDTNVFFSVHKQMDMVAFFSSVPAFAESWKQYALLYHLDMCKGRPGYPDYKLKCSYDIYRRK